MRLRDLLNVYLNHEARCSFLQSLPDYDSFLPSKTGTENPTVEGQRNLDRSPASSRVSGQNGALVPTSVPTTTAATPDTMIDPWQNFSFKPPSFHSAVFYELKDIVVVAEMQLLKRLGFQTQVKTPTLDYSSLVNKTADRYTFFSKFSACIQVDLPYNHMINYCKILDLVHKPGIVQLCWGILNDAYVYQWVALSSSCSLSLTRIPLLKYARLQTPIYTHYPPPTIACFSILLATRTCQIPLPDNWWILFDADWDDMWVCCGFVKKLWRDWGVVVERRCGEMDTNRAAKGLSSIKEARWRRGWQLATSRKLVRRYIEQVEAQEDKMGSLRATTHAKA